MPPLCPRNWGGAQRKFGGTLKKILWRFAPEFVPPTSKLCRRLCWPRSLAIPHMCYCADWSYVKVCMGIKYRDTSKFLTRWGPAAWDMERRSIRDVTPSSTCMGFRDRCWSNGMGALTEIRLATQDHRNWHGSIPINVSLQPWAYLAPCPRYNEMQAGNCDVLNSVNPLLFNAAAEGACFPWNLITALEFMKTEWWG